MGRAGDVLGSEVTMRRPPEMGLMTTPGLAIGENSPPIRFEGGLTSSAIGYRIDALAKGLPAF